MTSTERNRQAAGQPTGGQFAPTSGSDAGLDLGRQSEPVKHVDADTPQGTRVFRVRPNMDGSKTREYGYAYPFGGDTVHVLHDDGGTATVPLAHRAYHVAPEREQHPITVRGDGRRLLGSADAEAQVAWHMESGEKISDEAARTIASLYQSPGSASTLAAFASGRDVAPADLREEIEREISDPNEQMALEHWLDQSVARDRARALALIAPVTRSRTEDNTLAYQRPDGSLHNAQGPAIARTDGTGEFWWDGQQVSREQHAALAANPMSGLPGDSGYGFDSDDEPPF